MTVRRILFNGVRYLLGKVQRGLMATEDIPLMNLGHTASSPQGPSHHGGESSQPLMASSATRASDRARRISTETPDMRGYSFPTNSISNAKYNAFTFLPMILIEQFKFFFNLYFLLVALSQIWQPLRIGYLSSYIVPLAFVLFVTMSKEAWDDWQRRRRDAQANSERYQLVNGSSIKAQDLRVGQIIQLHTNQRVPADLVVLKSSEHNGETFIRTDQLDGETDWKLRTACSLTQNMPLVSSHDIELEISPPEKSISTFWGTIDVGESGHSVPLSIDNTMWANTVVAAGSIEGIIVYTGKDTRMAMNTSKSRNKVGLLELEVNSISKILCFCVFLLSFVLVAGHGFGPKWYIDIFRYLILFSTIIPVSLRVNLDMAKTVYAYQIENDKNIPETIVRTSTIPEDLGRIDYLLTDKTGTITQNDMDLRKIHIGQMSYYGDSMEEVESFISSWNPRGTTYPGASRGQREVSKRVCDIVTCLAICHSVTPTDEGGYQAVSPDEIAIVKWNSEMGLELVKRDRKTLSIFHRASGHHLNYEILYLFPFNSDSKRMGIVVRDSATKDIWFYLKGADTVMAPLVEHNDWLEEEIGNMAREGLRTLVIGRRKLEEQEFDSFAKAYGEASLLMSNRDAEVANVVSKYLEHDIELLGITGVEDKLQHDIKPSLELLRNAGIKIWMLTGDKVETAQCVAISSRLVARGQYIHVVTKLDSIHAAHQHLDYLSQVPDACLLMDGQSLQFFQDNLPEFAQCVLQLPVVIACRCTPQQKADLTKMVKRSTGKRTCAIGDGGNDVSMIQAADVGVGIVGKEGHQASLAADFSVTQFCHLTKLLLWHGRNSYKRSAKLAQFVIHRGLIISVCQAVYSISSNFEPLALYTGWLMVAYATVYTMMPVFSLVTDHDVDEHLARMYPELYKELKDGRALSWKSYFIWVLVSVYQGSMIQGLSQIFVGLSQQLFKKMVMVGFTALIWTELAMVALEVVTWNKTMILCEVVTLGFYMGSIPFLGNYFDLAYARNPMAYGKAALILGIVIVPIWVARVIERRLKPPSYAKVQV